MRHCLLIAAFIAVLGCGGKDQVETADVSGVVTFNDKPLEGALVTFSSTEFSAVAETNSEGKYTLPQGASLGENKVTISKIEKVPGFEGGPEEGMDMGQLQAADPGALGTNKNMGGEQLPAKYSNPEESILKYTVPEGGTDSANFKLTE